MNKPCISIIAAMSENKVIGSNNTLPWYLPGDLKRFKELTINHPIIMGRKTFDSLGRVLPQRTNIVITKDVEKFAGETYEKGLFPQFITQSLPDALKLAKKAVGSEEIFIIGGGQIFKEALDTGMVNRLYLTIIHKSYQGDVFFPAYPDFTNVVSTEDREYNGLSYTFVTLER